MSDQDQVSFKNATSAILNSPDGSVWSAHVIEAADPIDGAPAICIRVVCDDEKNKREFIRTFLSEIGENFGPKKIPKYGDEEA